MECSDQLAMDALQSGATAAGVGDGAVSANRLPRLSRRSNAAPTVTAAAVPAGKRQRDVPEKIPSVAATVLKDTRSAISGIAEGTQYLMLPRQHVVACDIERWKPEDFASMLMEMQPFMGEVCVIPPSIMNAISSLAVGNELVVSIDTAFKQVVNMAYKLAAMYWLCVHYERHRESDMAKWIMRHGSQLQNAVTEYKDAYKDVARTIESLNRTFAKCDSAVDKLNCNVCHALLRKLRELVTARMSVIVEQINREGMLLDNDRITL